MAGVSYTDLQTSIDIESNAFLRGLAFGYGRFAEGQMAFRKWSATTLTYDLRIDEANPDGTAAAAWTADLGTAIRTALDEISRVCGLRFAEVEGGADIDFWYYRADDGMAGYSYGIAGPGVFMNAFYDHTGRGDGQTAYAPGGLDYMVVVHEILHTLGLAHPHDAYATFPGVSGPYDTGASGLNQALYTVMSYNSVRKTDAEGQPTTGWPGPHDVADRGYSVLGAFDIAMLQALYGTGGANAAGDTVYHLPQSNEAGSFFSCIWDTGGIDTIRYSGDLDATIVLIPATLDPASGHLAGGALSRVEGIHGGFTISSGVAIENAAAGTGDDRLVGNRLANRLEGGGGADDLRGGGGRDVALGGEGADAIRGQGGGDRLRGGPGDDLLRAGGGRDLLIGEDGDDRLFGGLDADVFRFDLGDGHDRIGDFEIGWDLIEIVGPGVTPADISITAHGRGTLLAFGDTTVLLLGIAPDALSEADFLLTG